MDIADVQMIRNLEKSAETAGIEAKSAILHGFSVTGRLEEALDLYEAFKMEHVLPLSYAVGTLLVREFFCLIAFLNDLYFGYKQFMTDKMLFVCICVFAEVADLVQWYNLNF